jgi:hypothetical protein
MTQHDGERTIRQAVRHYTHCVCGWVFNTDESKECPKCLWNKNKEIAMSSFTTTPEHPPQTLMAGGKAASTKGPSFHLIPTVALVKLAERFELGEERKGDKAWNATSKNQECLMDKEWAIERCSHIIHHAMKLRDQLAGLEADESPTDNASAIAWGGVFLICATDAIAKQTKDESCST